MPKRASNSNDIGIEKKPRTSKGTGAKLLSEALKKKYIPNPRPKKRERIVSLLIFRLVSDN